MSMKELIIRLENCIRILQDYRNGRLPYSDIVTRSGRYQIKNLIGDMIDTIKDAKSLIESDLTGYEEKGLMIVNAEEYKNLKRLLNLSSYHISKNTELYDELVSWRDQIAG